MEFRFRAGEERDPSFLSASLASSSSGYFATKAMRAGFARDIEDADYRLIHPKRPLEVLEMELQEELRIREEIIARKVAQRRMLEERVRREMEIEHAMLIRRQPVEVEPIVEPLMLLPPEDRTMERFGSTVVPHYREIEFDERLSPPANPEKLPTSELKRITEIELSHSQLSGKKRKPVLASSSSKFPQPVRKEWSCALCQVSATSEEGLKDHLRGKKHMAKAAQHERHESCGSSNERAAGSKSRGASALKQKSAVRGKERGLQLPTQGLNKVSIQVDGKLHQVMQKGKYLWCWICKIKCNSTPMMVAHLSGKKHFLMTRGSKYEDSKQPLEASGESSDRETDVLAEAVLEKEFVEEKKDVNKECD